MPRRGPTALERTTVAFQRAGRDGLTRRELKRIAGRRYRDVVRQLEADGFLVLKRPSKYDDEPWRYIAHPPLLDETTASPTPDPPAAEPDVPQLQLPVPTTDAERGER